MNAVVVTADNKIYATDLSEPLWRSVASVVGGYSEHVSPFRLRRPFCFLCNEDGYSLHLPVNEIASYLYGSDIHGAPVLGDVVILKDCFSPDFEPDIVFLSPEDIDQVYSILLSL